MQVSPGDTWELCGLGQTTSNSWTPIHQLPSRQRSPPHRRPALQGAAEVRGGRGTPAGQCEGPCVGGRSSGNAVLLTAGVLTRVAGAERVAVWLQHGFGGEAGGEQAPAPGERRGERKHTEGRATSGRRRTLTVVLVARRNIRMSQTLCLLFKM